eukprot:GHVL01011853.1.p1 GENE.GHVL01011853.1~~GHVL01011853.1.p1  ORF type:complete len:107 (+),score=17.10 GHVL01011853.1:251-571(+)
MRVLQEPKDFWKCEEHKQQCTVYCESCEILLCSHCFSTTDSAHAACRRISIPSALATLAETCRQYSIDAERQTVKICERELETLQELSQFQREFEDTGCGGSDNKS